TGSMSIIAAILLVVFMAAVLVFIVFMERGQRRIPIHYAKRQMGRKMFGGQTTHLPLRVNTAGVIPPIFASSLLMFPATVAQFSEAAWLKSVSDWFNMGGLIYNLIFVGLIVFFCFFYTAIIFDTKDISENLKKQGGFIPGIRPGAPTQVYIDKVLTRITVWGAMYISAVCVLPNVMREAFNFQAFYFGGTSLLIVVGVAMDFMSQVESHMISRQYDGLMNKGARIKGRNG
ncbi:preprotein translocase subunit SecY, partial [Desulfovibrio sp. OttesenSCG-928-C14]|nr:preprotein translocase subunit SecY [Desulfovibrio sp. OttesenSCG-928-C14]